MKSKIYDVSKTRFVNIATFSGMLVFFAVLIASIVFLSSYPPVLISPEFNNAIRPYLITVSLYPTISFLMRAYSLWKSKAMTKQRTSFLMAGLLTALLVYWLTYSGIANILTSHYHSKAQKENIVIEANFDSAWPSRKNIRSDCKYGLLFDSPRISHPFKKFA